MFADIDGCLKMMQRTKEMKRACLQEYGSARMSRACIHNYGESFNQKENCPHNTIILALFVRHYILPCRVF